MFMLVFRAADGDMELRAETFIAPDDLFEYLHKRLNVLNEYGDKGVAIKEWAEKERDHPGSVLMIVPGVFLFIVDADGLYHLIRPRPVPPPPPVRVDVWLPGDEDDDT